MTFINVRGTWVKRFLIRYFEETNWLQLPDEIWIWEISARLTSKDVGYWICHTLRWGERGRDLEENQESFSTHYIWDSW